MTVLPSVTVTYGATVVATPPSGTLEMRYARPSSEQDIVGEPALTLTYRGFALPSSTFVYARVVDAAAGRIAGDQVTPIPVVLDGLQHTVTRKLEAIALRGRPTSDLRLQLVTSTSLYGPQRSAGTITVSAMTSTLPLVDAALPAARPTAAPPPPPAVAAPASPIGDLLGRLRRLVGIPGR
jgi:ABC-2 type transport system ATP-binding protein